MEKLKKTIKKVEGLIRVYRYLGYRITVFAMIQDLKLVRGNPIKFGDDFIEQYDKM